MTKAFGKGGWASKAFSGLGLGQVSFGTGPNHKFLFISGSMVVSKDSG